MITHYVVSYNHDTKEWSTDGEATDLFIGNIMNGLTWANDEVDWICLPIEEMLLLSADLGWRLRRKEYQNG
jgi:hypothetical protein